MLTENPTHFLTLVTPTEKRRQSLTGDKQEYLTEGAVMLAYALHLQNAIGAHRVTICPDGEHAKRYKFRAELSVRGFEIARRTGKTDYGGVYCHADGREIIVHPQSGRGDISADLASGRIFAEAKGGIVNSKHPGVQSKLRRGLYEAVGKLLETTAEPCVRQVAVVPDTPLTRRLANQIIARSRRVGIEIALVDGNGIITEVS